MNTFCLHLACLCVFVRVADKIMYSLKMDFLVLCKESGFIFKRINYMEQSPP